MFKNILRSCAILFFGMCYGGCDVAAQQPAAYYYPPVRPIWIVEDDPNTTIYSRKDLKRDRKVGKMLVIPLYMYYQHEGKTEFLAIAHPFVYEQGEDIEKRLSSFEQRKNLRTLIFWVPGYFPDGLGRTPSWSPTINGKRMAVIELQRCLGSEENEINAAMKTLLLNGDFTVGKGILDAPRVLPYTHELKITNDPYNAFLLVRSMEYNGRIYNGIVRNTHVLWAFTPGTKIVNCLSAEEKKTVAAFAEQAQQRSKSITTEAPKAGGKDTVQTDDVFSKFEQAASTEGKTASSLYEAMAEGIEKNPAEVLKKLLPRLQDKSFTERQLAVYVWALGLTKDPAAVDPIMDLRRRSQSPLVKQNCLRALASIGGKQAEKYLLSVLDSTTDKKMRFEILSLLGQMQCEAALPKMEEVLRKDPREFYWQSIFVFGKMGDKAVPFLLQKIGDKNRNVRTNAINILGKWLIAPEAVKPLQEQLWKETDAKLRGVIIDSVLRITPDPAQIKSVCEEIVAKEKDVRFVILARAAIAGMDRLKAGIASFAKAKKVSKDSFQQEYARLFKSAGKKGGYNILSVASTVEDEPKLKALRERILQRDSDEAFYDYEKVNKIILQNRMIGREKP